MQSHYDLLGVRPDDDAETIRTAFRKAAMATHPDRHGGDPEAAARFRQISEAYEILRDAEQRAAYDRQLKRERGPSHQTVKQSRSGMRWHVVLALLAIVLAVGGYQLFARIPERPGDGPVGVTARESGQAAAGRDRPERVPAPQMTVAMPPAAAATALAGHDRPEMTNGEPVSNPAGQTIAVASRGSEADVPAGAGVPGKPEGERPLRHDVSLGRRDGETPKPAGANTGGVKLPEINTSAHAPAAPKRHTPSRPKAEQAELENKNAPAPDKAPAPSNAPSRVLGVGF
jgi:curved DNA-binding protein CbpA